ncbi:MAG TPA: M14 family metallopeptidase, partial [Prolixibacteraceae bacterium]|nr:M14 family metallopeptidase [Prolixibacteraceae bacterium]
EEGRDIYGLTINNPKTGEALSKPGVYVDGNIHGNEIQAGEVCLYFANMLLTRYGENDKITKVVDKNAYYIIPVVNVDGRAHFFLDAQTSSTDRSFRVPKDDDRDGLVDEDNPDDLDADGNICIMRIRDPLGDYKTDPEDKRLMIPVKPGEKGEWTILGQEGIDNDKDGRINEDSEGYFDANRNWGSDWQPPYVQNGAGNFPLSGYGVKAIATYIHQRPNIIVNFAFHNSGGMWLRAPSHKDEKLDVRDIAVYDLIGKNALKITPGYVYMPSYDLYDTFGDTDSHMFNLEGSYTFVGELFMRSQETYRENISKPLTPPADPAGSSTRRGSSPDESRELINFNDYLGLNELYKTWKSFKHPTYGEIEIGGWVKMSSRLPHPFMLPELAHRNAMVVLYASEQTPEISMEIFDVKEIGNNLRQVRVRLKNEKGLPSMSYKAISTRLYTQDILRVSGAKVIASGKITDLRNNKISYQEHKPEIIYTSVPGYGYAEYQFLVEGKGELAVNYSSVKAGSLTKTVKL